MRYFMLALFLVIQVWDVWQSKEILDNGGVEKNKLIRRVIEKLGVLPGLVATKLVLTTPIILAGILVPYKEISWLLAGLNAYYLVVLRHYLKRLL